MKKNLKLKSETLRRLSSAELAIALGGVEEGEQSPSRIWVDTHCVRYTIPYTDNYTNCACGTQTCDGCTLITF